MSTAINSLNFMYNMERFATEIYRIQNRAFKENEIKDKLNAATENERQHAVSLKARSMELKGNPSRLGFLFQTAGCFLGFMAIILGKKFTLRADIWIEKRAIRDYGKYLKNVEFDEESISLIKRIIIDEERHVETWQNCIKTLKAKT